MFGDANVSGAGGFNTGAAGAIDSSFGPGAGFGGGTLPGTQGAYAAVGDVGGDVTPIAGSTSIDAVGNTLATSTSQGLGAAPESPGLLQGALDWTKANPLAAGSLGLGAIGVGRSLLSGNSPPYTSQLTSNAQQAGTMGTALSGEAQKFLQPSLTGQLPPQLEAQVQQALQQAITTEKSKYASLGLGNSTMSADQEASMQLQAEVMRGQLAQQLAQTGTQLMGQATQDLSIEAGIYQQLMNAQVQQDTALEQSITGFAQSLAYSSVAGNRQQNLPPAPR
jgi:hypothetical protein